MRVLSFFLVLICLGITLAIKLPQSNSEILRNKDLEILLAKTISNQIITRLELELSRSSFNTENGALVSGSLIPPIEDDLILPPVNLVDIFIPIPDLLNVTGNLAFGESTVTGLSNLTDIYDLTGTGPATLTWDMFLPTVSIVGTFDMDLTAELGSSHSVIGKGAFSASVDNVFFELTAKGRTLGKLRLDELKVDLGFSNLKLQGDETKVDGEVVVDWQNVANILDTYFHTIWNPEVQGIVNEMVRCQIDHVVNDCTLVQLINPETCLKVELNPKCFGIDEPTTPAPTGPTTPAPTGPTTPAPTGPTGSTTTETPGGGSLSLEASKLILLLALGYIFVF